MKNEKIYDEIGKPRAPSCFRSEPRRPQRVHKGTCIILAVVIIIGIVIAFSILNWIGSVRAVA